MPAFGIAAVSYGATRNLELFVIVFVISLIICLIKLPRFLLMYSFSVMSGLIVFSLLKDSSSAISQIADLVSVFYSIFQGFLGPLQSNSENYNYFVTLIYTTIGVRFAIILSSVFLSISLSLGEIGSFGGLLGKGASSDSNSAALENGIKFSNRGKYETALKIFDGILTSNPSNIEALFNKAINLVNIGMYADAINTYLKVINSRKKINKTTFEKAIEYDQKGDYSKAIEECKRNLEIHFELKDQPKNNIFDKIKKYRVPNEAIGPLIQLINDNKIDVRGRMASALILGNSKDPHVVEALLSILMDKNICLRCIASNALSEIGRPAINSLISILNSDKIDTDSRCLAAYALGKIENESALNAVDALILALKDNEGKMRATAAQALGIIKNQKSFEPLIQAANDLNENVRLQAIIALGNIKDSDAIGHLVQALQKDNNAEVRSAAASALGTFEDLGTVDPLAISFKHDKDSDVRDAAHKSLERIKQSTAYSYLSLDQFLDNLRFLNK